MYNVYREQTIYTNNVFCFNWNKIKMNTQILFKKEKEKRKQFRAFNFINVFSFNIFYSNFKW